MKFNPDLLREILLYTEKNACKPISNLENIAIEGYSTDEIAYQVILAEEGILIAATIDYLPDADDPDVTHVVYTVQRLTAKGHEFLEAIRDPRHWIVIKESAKRAGSMTLNALFEIGSHFVKHEINRYFGFDLS